MYLGKADVNTYEKGVEREFLVSDGSGGYGFSTVVGANTRREHGLLVVRNKGEALHNVLVSKIEETLTFSGKKYQLSTNRYKDLAYPDGYRYLQEYQGTPVPSMLFVIHSIFLQKSIFMPQGSGCTIIKYRLMASPEPITLDLRPLVAHRKYTEVTSEKTPFQVEPVEKTICVTGGGLKSCLSFSGGEWLQKPLWFEKLIYETEGTPESAATDNLWSPGYNTVKLSQGDVIYVVLSESPRAYSLEDIKKLETETYERLGSFVKEAEVPVRYSVIQDMIHASYHLVDDREGSPAAVYSGYPSVSLRARETFIGLPGLTIATGREKTGIDVLERWLGYCEKKNWVMPGYIDYSGTPEFDGADTGLWFIYAVEKFAFHEGTDFAKKIWPSLQNIVGRYIDGCAELGACADDNGLIRLCDGEACNHWMSGEVVGESLVKRKGYLVEFNALWYNALRFMEGIAMEMGEGDVASRYSALADKCRDSFEATFWNAEKKYLYDWVDPNGGHDDAIRPNMVLAISLSSSPLRPEIGRELLATCWNELYTTYGLRTLDPHHEKFKGKAEGRPDQKIKARFRGMAWPWLLGQFITAYVRFNPESKDIAWAFMRPFNSHLRHGCLGGVAEYFDGIMPYRPNGDVLSAASLGELLRVLREDLLVDSARK